MTANKPTIDKRKRLPVIWFIPVIALVLGVWMVVNAKLSEGPSITIQFETAEGITAGKTKVRYLNVEAGLVTAIRLTDDQKAVLLEVELVPQAAALLREDTRFWVVKARVGAGSVTGLGTLLGGAYIELSPGEGASGTREYIGLETPPLSPSGALGIKVTLFADKAGSISTSDAVLYNGYKVGIVEGMSFDEVKKQVRYDLFIEAPFDRLVTDTVRFWNISGIEMKASAAGIELMTGSMDTILFGGVAFGIPDGAQAGTPVESGAEFKLFADYNSTQEQPYSHEIEYVMEFEQSLRGLLPGAPVAYRGIELGYVKRIMVDELLADQTNSGRPIPVLIGIEPGRFGMPDTAESLEKVRTMLEQGVAVGMRGAVETGNLLTGSLYITVDHRADSGDGAMGRYKSYQSIPTVSTGFKLIQEQLSSVLTKLDNLPLEETLAGIGATMQSINAVVEATVKEDVPTDIASALTELREVLSGFSADSPFYRELESSVSKFYDILYNIEQFSTTVKDQPNSLLFNPKLPEDPVLKAPRR